MQFIIDNFDPIVTAIGLIFTVALPFLHAALKNVHLRRLSVFAEYVVRQYKPIVDDLKNDLKDGVWSDEEKARIKKDALAKLRSFAWLPIILWFFGGKANTESLLEAVLEGTVEKVNAEAKAANPT